MQCFVLPPVDRESMEPAVQSGLEFDGGTAAICRRADWPQCLVNETVVFGQIGRALFHLQVTSN